MKLTSVLLAAVLHFTLTTAGYAQDAKEAGAPDKPKVTADELEAKFKETMTASVMTGRWCSIKEGVLGPEKDEKYTIVGVEKVGGDAWIIKARMQYGQREVDAPIPVQVKWAGDTAVIIVDNLKIPSPGGAGGSAYSARVLIYENTYAGTWSAGERGGLLKGIITKDK